MQGTSSTCVALLNCHKNSALTISPLPGLQIRLEAASTFSVPNQLRRTYPHGRLSSTVLARILYIAMTLPGYVLPGVLRPVKRVCR